MPEYYKKILVRIATPYSTGTGFCLRSSNIIITSDHLVRDNQSVVVEGPCVERQLVQVIYSDPKYDLAFLALPKGVEVPEVALSTIGEVNIGNPIMAVGYPFGMRFEMRRGHVTNAQYLQDDVHYVLHDAVMNPVYSGGPLIDKEGQIMAVNTFATWEEDATGLSLPAKYLLALVEDFQAGAQREGMRCMECEKVVFSDSPSSKSCPNCPAPLQFPSVAKPYEPQGVAKTIEALLQQMGHQVALSRIGPNTWQIQEGSAKINISYYEKTGLIIGDAYLCRLPPLPSKPLQEYLLRQNYEIENLTLSVKGTDIVLSLLIYDRYLNADTATSLFSHLFVKADYYDNVLVEEFGATWIEEEEDDVDGLSIRQ